MELLCAYVYIYDMIHSRFSKIVTFIMNIFCVDISKRDIYLLAIKLMSSLKAITLSLHHYPTLLQSEKL